MTNAELLRAAIEASGLTVEEFAESVPLPQLVSRRTLFRWRSGEGEIPPEALPTLRKLAGKLGRSNAQSGRARHPPTDATHGD